MKVIVKDQPLRAGLYARVSSEQQADAGTLASQRVALEQRLVQDGFAVEEELCFVDDGYSGSSLVRPGLERLRDAAAAGAVDRLYVLAPDRLARKLAHQVLLVDELQHWGVELCFLNRPLGSTPEDQLLLQVQGMVAEYERAKILERSRRGKLHAARSGSVSVLGSAPYGYRYLSKQAGGGQARYEIVSEQAQVVQQIFAWVGRDRCTLAQVSRRLAEQHLPSPTGQAQWSTDTLRGLLLNRAYTGTAEFGKQQIGPAKPRLRPRRGQPTTRRRSYSVRVTTAAERIGIPVPALIESELFAQAAEQLAENLRRRRAWVQGVRYLLQGLVVCPRCGYACSARSVSYRAVDGALSRRAYYRCNGSVAPSRGVEKVCNNRAVRGDVLEAAVWTDVCALLQHPEKLQEEYERRLQDRSTAEQAPAQALAKQIQQVQRGIARLIDGYEEGFLDKSEFEPRIRGAKERLHRLQEEAASATAQEAEEQQLRLAIGCLQDFASRVQHGLHEADWTTRRNILQTLVKYVEVDLEKIRIVYRISPVPFVEGPTGGFLQDCLRREGAQGDHLFSEARTELLADTFNFGRTTQLKDPGWGTSSDVDFAKPNSQSLLP